LLAPRSVVNCCDVIFWLFAILALLVVNVCVVPSAALMVNVFVDASKVLIVPEIGFPKPPPPPAPPPPPPLLVPPGAVATTATEDVVVLSLPHAARTVVAASKRKAILPSALRDILVIMF
jgi:hypothetical protein